MNTNVERIRHCLGEVKEMHDLIEGEITEIEGIIAGKKNKLLKDADIKKVFGDFSFKELGGGRIQILDDWGKKNIVRIAISDVFMECNSKIAYQVIGAVSEVIRYGYKEYFNWTKNSGCFVPRHKTWNPERELSSHSWGISIDVDPEGVPYGTDIRHNKEVVKIFDRWGFLNGQDWKPSDAMHFQWGRFV